MAESTSKLKRELLDLLEKDVEFRYAVAGLLGISEILRRLEKLEESLVRLWEEVRNLRVDQGKLWEGQSRMWEEVKELIEGQRRLWEEVRALRESQHRLLEEMRDARVVLRGISTTLERLTLAVEEEAREIIRYRLRRELNIEVELGRAFVDSREINIYGVSDDLCVVGEATVRLGVGLVRELLDKVELLKRRRPDLLRRRLVKVVFTDYALPEAIELAERNNVWVLRWDRDLTPLRVEECGSS
jgi:chromosome segregation ATPase